MKAVSTTAKKQAESFRYRQVSAFSHLLVFVPLVIVFLLFRNYVIAGAILAAGILSARLAGKPKRRRSDRPLIVFSIIRRPADPLHHFAHP